MDILFYILIGIGGLVALFLILRLLGSCLLRLFLAFAALALGRRPAIFRLQQRL